MPTDPIQDKQDAEAYRRVAMRSNTYNDFTDTELDGILSAVIGKRYPGLDERIRFHQQKLADLRRQQQQQ